MSLLGCQQSGHNIVSPEWILNSFTPEMNEYIHFDLPPFTFSGAATGFLIFCSGYTPSRIINLLKNFIYCIVLASLS